MEKKKSKQRLLLELCGILLGLLWLSPFYLMVVNAFKTKLEIFTNTTKLPATWTFDNFTQAFKELAFLKTFMNSLILSVVSIAIILFFSAMAAYALSRNKSKLSGVIFFLFVAAMLIPFQSVMIPLVSLFGKMNALNFYGLMFMYLGFGCSLSIFLYYGALKGIPKSLDEAATIDGCNKFQVFWYIILPMLKPISVTVAILNIIWIWNDYLLPSLVISGAGTDTIPLKLFLFFGQYTKQWHLALAGLTISIIPVIVFYLLAQKQIIKGVSEGAVK
ncbi:carbohydrate ABC transporter permease [Lysinibacillus piscis]|uniref:Sugar ABC transporter permease n=1 Tax=Lysinibacillus piscis TaxID=2518931 RepID=A0ABQ5NLH0_9BACI|nr:carbohydrate ABC transporter permease [Lysinibacillus sp. KH24]GLC88942.1 sugar ABC transporter permease [Lysinibacillus sp. KH24]